MIVISNGFNKFHMSCAAAELQKHGLLSSYITGAYPTPLIRSWLKLSLLHDTVKMRRLRDRKENIPDNLVHPIAWPEILQQLSRFGKPFGSGVVTELDALSLRCYAARSIRYVRAAAERGVRLYHYRAGFGHRSVRVAKKFGIFSLCDHSIAHPTVLSALVSNKGTMGENPILPRPTDRLWSDILDDIEQADAVLVNSDFVKQTFLSQGWPESRLKVIYLGVDDQFLNCIPESTSPKISGPLRLMFAGLFNTRKGAEIVINALHKVKDTDWILYLAGAIAPEIYKAHREFFREQRVVRLGLLSRPELAQALCKAEVFIFPSLAEGSARVVFEALACGLYVVTTPNSGSIVKDKIHGRLVPPGDPTAIAAAIRDAAANRPAVSEIGKENARLVRAHYRQSSYGEEIIKLYWELLNSRTPVVAGGSFV